MVRFGPLSRGTNGEKMAEVEALFVWIVTKNFGAFPANQFLARMQPYPFCFFMLQKGSRAHDDTYERIE